jgi:16S rRNA (adenine1518-N6/adenine1519-N6)-dimethyltransferase
MAPNQTLSFLQKRFREIGLEPDARRGQNFLIDMNLLRMLASTAELERRDVALEVGTGTGSLTALLAEHAGQVITVEVDGHLHQLASELLFDCDNITMLLQDALRNKNNLDVKVIDAVKEALAAKPGRRLKLVANLPYSVATPIISNLLTGDIVPVTMTATIQKELADRIVASPGSKDYSSLSIWIQCQCRAEIIRLMPPSVFWPRPKVTSAIIQIVVEPERRALIPDLTYFHNFVRAMFFHRRKFLRSNILGAFKDRLEKPEVDEILAANHLDGNARSETLSVETLLALCESVRSRVPDWTL